MDGTPIDHHEPLTDAELWGARPVLWGLRMLGIDPHRMAEDLTGSERREACDFLGIELAGADNSATWECLRTAVYARQHELGNDKAANSRLFENLGLLQDTLGLTDIEVDLAAFRAMLRLHPGFEVLAGKYIGLCTDFVFHRKLARLFETSYDKIAAALSPQSPLVHHGVMSVVEGCLGPLENRIRLIQGLITPLIRPARSAAELLASVLPAKREPRLALSDYPHIATEITLIRARLAHGLAQRSPGINVLLYGIPGVGKSELAAALAASLGCPLYGLPSVDDTDDSQTPRARLRKLTQLQRLAHATGAGLVLVDEAEDLFPTVWSDSEKTPTKAAVNACLEENPTPTIWISNRIQHMDTAFLRRFDVVVKVPPLPSSLKQNLLRDALPARSLTNTQLRRVSRNPELTPGILTRIAIVAQSGRLAADTNVGDAIEVLANGYLRSLGARPLSMGDQLAALPHDPTLLNTAPPLAHLLGVIQPEASARLLLYGPPGTGKTAWGKALAEHLDQPLIQRTASSLLSPYIGETEHNLREMFDEARQEGGVLLLDEADSFLSARDRVHARWEVTQTNELLTQIEDFEGLLVCTTNRLDDLDPAALRRFDFKVAFRPPGPDQRLALIRQCCRQLGIPAPTDNGELMKRIRALDGCTPGDAAAVLRRMAVSHEARSLDALLCALADECRFKPTAHAPIGFVR